MAEAKKVEEKQCATGVCPGCGSANCTCKNANCGFAKVDKVLCLILKVVKIIVFIALAYVLFDIHSVIKQTEKNYMAASAGMPAGMAVQPGQGNQP